MDRMTFGVHGQEVQRFFERSKARTSAAVDAEIKLTGRRLLNAVKHNASGRPGPNKVTGQYQKSIQLEVVRRGHESYARVYSDHPAAHRLEYGYIGTDSRGRHVYAPAYPHFRPAFEEVKKTFYRTIRDTITRGVRW